MRIPCRGLLLDLDGVLVDSTPAVERVWTRWALEHGFEPKEVVRQAHGRPSLATLRELLPDGNAEAEDREMERREIEDLGGVVALPGAAEILRAIPASRWAIVTSGTQPLARVRIRTAGLPEPLHLITASEVARGKPHPDPYLAGAASLGLAGAECVVIEDAAAGVHAGKAAGARVIAVRTTMEGAELAAAGADWVVENLAALRVDGTGGGEGLAIVLESEK